MITFTLCLLALIVGYFTYGRLMERIFGPDDRKTPALTRADGVDYIPLPTWKIFMIQFLNIAGLGPIFGAIMGAKFGTSSYLWIVFGSIFAGAVHDYFAGMLSLRNGGESLPEIVGRYLGLTTKQVMRGFGRIGVRCRTGGIIGKTDTGITGYDFLDHCGLCVLYPCYFVAGR